MTASNILLTVLGIAGLGLIIFLSIKNQKERKKLTDQLNNDYPKTKERENEIELAEKE